MSWKKGDRTVALFLSSLTAASIRIHDQRQAILPAHHHDLGVGVAATRDGAAADAEDLQAACRRERPATGQLQRVLADLTAERDSLRLLVQRGIEVLGQSECRIPLLGLPCPVLVGSSTWRPGG